MSWCSPALSTKESEILPWWHSWGTYLELLTSIKRTAIHSLLDKRSHVPSTGTGPISTEYLACFWSHQPEPVSNDFRGKETKTSELTWVTFWFPAMFLSLNPCASLAALEHQGNRPDVVIHWCIGYSIRVKRSWSLHSSSYSHHCFCPSETLRYACLFVGRWQVCPWKVAYFFCLCLELKREKKAFW